MEDLASDAGAKDASGVPKTSRFHFKSKSESRPKRRHRSRVEERDDDHTSRRARSRERNPSKHRHRSKRRSRRSPEYDRKFPRNGAYENPENRHRESLYDDLFKEHQKPTSLDPDAAFRESLFDAMADDEGAAYWEGVYGQPLHTYPNTKPGPDGKLERMEDEEYAEYVRTKMWEKSHQHILEERAARERLRKKQREDRDRLDDDIAKDEREKRERAKILRQMEASLRRGEERRRTREADTYWNQYLSRWDQLKSNKPTIDTAEQAQELIPWPVASGKLRHLDGDEIERFLRASSAWKNDPAAILKVERVRWHPDKMQQRFGQHIDVDTMKSVTAVFQVIDRLWNKYK
ncbi:unnamed protein product [Periconia digitata]|uniref:Uncharacterized protein n=1 Tax=Periconia digitata TaxID=1303443 RepID=A0A9W4XXF0_9PLEO|nr:unnamed protein product [Periconia digitata]